MGIYVQIRGWIEGDEESINQIEGIVSKPAGPDVRSYMDGWCRPKRVNWTSYCFFGADVLDRYLDDIKTLMQEIAAVKSIDGEFTNYVVGVFHLDHEDGEHRWIWELREGKLIAREM